MRQVHVQETWAGIAYGSEREVMSELMARIQILENRLRELEGLVKGSLEADVAEQQILPEPEPAAVSS